MNIVPVLTMLAALNSDPNQLNMQDLSPEGIKVAQTESLLGIAAPMQAVVQNEADEIIIS
jgi:hypothetical protein